MKGMCTHCGDNPIYAKGLCRNCYVRNKRNGSPESLGHKKSDRKIEVWKENGKDFTKAAKILGCSKQAVYCAVKLYYKPTNADRIRSMTDEELAEFMFRTFGKAAWCLDNNCPPEESCVPCWLEWLKLESENLNEQTN